MTVNLKLVILATHSRVRYALVAHLDRVQASEAWGSGFESLRARHLIQNK